MIMLKFKIGDTVKIIGTDDYFTKLINKIGIIIMLNGDSRWPYNIDISYPDGSKDTLCAGEDEIEYVVKVGEQLEFDFMKDDIL